MSETRDRMALLRQLGAEIKGDLAELDRIAASARRLFKKLDASGRPAEEDMMSLAAYLHHYYTGVETVLARIAEQLDGHVPQGSRWHVELVELMSVPLEDVRPAVLTKETTVLLADYRGFRHVFRHGYRTPLDWRRLRILGEDLPKLHDLISGDFERVVRFLEAMTKSAQP